MKKKSRIAVITGGEERQKGNLEKEVFE